MTGPSPPNLTALLQAWSRGDTQAGDEVLPLVYRELHRQAAGYLRRERRGHSLQPTALRELAALDPGKSRLVELRFFGGLTAAEAAGVMGVSESTVTREWRLARAWLHRRLREV